MSLTDPAFEYHVVPMTELFEWPGNLSSDWANTFAARFEEALNVLAEEGWEFWRTYEHQHHLQPGYAIFRRPR